MRRAVVWIAATTIGYGVGATVAVTVMGAVGHAVSAMLSGTIFLAAFGALIGVFVGPIQFVALRERSVRSNEWVTLTIAGTVFGSVVGAFVGEALGDAISPTANIIVGGGAIEMISGAVIGGAIGFAQQRAMRRDNVRFWALATAVGAALGWGAAGLILEIIEIEFLRAGLIPSFGAIVGLFVGAAQAFVLTRGNRIARE